MPNVVYLHKTPDPITSFTRVGMSGHRQLEELLLSGRLNADRLVVEAEIAKLKLPDEKMMTALGKNVIRLERMRDVLENLHMIDVNPSRAVAFRPIQNVDQQSRMQDRDR